MDIKVIGCEYVSWIYVASWQDVTKQIINLRVPDWPENFCSGFASDCICSLIYISRLNGLGNLPLKKKLHVSVRGRPVIRTAFYWPNCLFSEYLEWMLWEAVVTNYNTQEFVIGTLSKYVCSRFLSQVISVSILLWLHPGRPEYRCSITGGCRRFPSLPRLSHLDPQSKLCGRCWLLFPWG
jgi:hypothetical protein